MDGKKHVPIGIVASVVMYLLTYYYYENGDTFSLVFFSVIGALFPDLDQLGKRHRDAITHSAIVPSLMLVYMLVANINRYYDVFFFTISLGLHLICDYKFDATKKMGTYCIVKPGFVIRKKKGKTDVGLDRMTVKHSDIWLVGNALVCLGILLYMYLAF